MKIYTKTGDSGTTGLFAGPRVPKDHPRIAAYGTVDELNAVLGVVAVSLRESELAERIQLAGESLAGLMEDIQRDLFAIGAQLATPDAEKHRMCLLAPERIQDLEGMMDELEENLTPLGNFILPGGSQAAAYLHLARTVCRRAERDVVGLSHHEQNCETVVIYLNRLSDLLFLLARQVNAALGVPDVGWKKD